MAKRGAWETVRLQGGQIVAYKVGKVWRIKWSDVEEYLIRNRLR